MASTQLKDKNNNNIYPVVEDGGGATPSVGELHVLGLGNSYMADTAGYLNDICQRLGVDNVNFQYTNQGSASLSLWAGHTAQDDRQNFNLSTGINGGSLYSSTARNLYSIFSENWDVVVLQQQSINADDYRTFVPHLANLIERIKEICPNKSVKIAFHMTWDTEYIDSNSGDTLSASYDDIVTTTKSMLADYGQSIDFLIPTGTGIQNIRATSLNNNVNNFSQNPGVKWHLQAGVGEYVAACTFFEAFVKRICGKNVTIFADNATYNVSGIGAVSVTNENRDICHRCAAYAVIQPWSAMQSALLEGV